MTASHTIFNLVKRELVDKQKKFLRLMIAITLLLTIILIKQVYTNDINNGLALIQFIFGAFGIYIASIAFEELGSPFLTRAYLLIPATALEKTVAKFLVYSLGTWLLFILAWLNAIIITGIIQLLPGNTFTLAAVTSSLRGIILILPGGLLNMLFIQSLTIFASCYFRKSVLTKLTIVVIGLPLVLGVISLGAIRIIYMHNSWYHNARVNEQVQTWLAHIPFGTIYNVVILCICVFLWGLTWLRLRETEV